MKETKPITYADIAKALEKMNNESHQDTFVDNLQELIKAEYKRAFGKTASEADIRYFTNEFFIFKRAGLI